MDTARLFDDDGDLLSFRYSDYSAGFYVPKDGEPDELLPAMTMYLDRFRVEEMYKKIMERLDGVNEKFQSICSTATSCSITRICANC